MSAPTTAPETSNASVEASAQVTVERPTWRVLRLRCGWIAFLVALDLWSKAWVFRWLESLPQTPLNPGHTCAISHTGDHPRVQLLGDWLAVMPSLNPGAAFGRLDSIPWLLVTGRIVAALVLIWLVARAATGRRLTTLALVLILAGALGNLFDNLLRERELVLDTWYSERPFGPVRDFVDVYFSVWQWHFPTFNVADSCISVGAALLLLSGFAAQPRPAPAS